MSDRYADDFSYNPSGNFTDTAEYKQPRDEADDIPVGARGADNQSTGVNAAQEDFAAADSETTGQVNQGEVDDLTAGSTQEERSKSGTRGKKVDAFRQEAALDAMDFNDRT